MKSKNILLSSGIFLLVVLAIASCSKEESPVNPPLPGTTPNPSFVEEFDSAGSLTRKGWVFKNNSFPAGQSGWRQGRYEAMPVSTPANKKGGFTGPVPYLGFPAYSAKFSPQDFISCDITALGDPNGEGGVFSAWLISPQLTMSNGDSIIFYTRAIDDTYYPVYTKDRLQVRGNFTNGSADIGRGAADVGGFTNVLLDINSTYIENYNGGYPEVWTKYVVTIPANTLPSTGIRNGRFAFRYFAEDAGFFGGSGGENFPSLIGIDSLAFRHH